ncbi:MAG: hypothetical protein E3J78_00475 [Candidatus Cloacimonadota bacterium]|nr:MAG: hypothetical protein E3J78_00475 [Candidatus Cloacimonadota bacterium]
MGKYKFLYFVIIAAVLSCYKIPSEPPEWGLRINIPLGDSMVTAQDIVNDTSINHKFTIERDPEYNDTLWTVFHYSDSATGFYYGSGPQVLTMTIKQKISNNIDTTQSHYNSFAKKLLTRIYLRGSVDTAFYGTVVCSLSPPESLQHFTDFVDTFPVYLPVIANLDTTLHFVFDSFPIGPYKNFVTLYHDSGAITVDSGMGYAKMPIDFMSCGDTIVTFLKGIENKEDLRTNEDKNIVKRVIVHLVIMNRTAAGLTGNFRIGTKDSSIVYNLHPVTIPHAPYDPSTGFTLPGAEPTITVVEDTLAEEYINMTNADSLFWKASITIPALQNVFLKPEDWIRMYGYVSVDLWFDKESLTKEDE